VDSHDQPLAVRKCPFRFDPNMAWRDCQDVCAEVKTSTGPLTNRGKLARKTLVDSPGWTCGKDPQGAGGAWARSRRRWS